MEQQSTASHAFFVTAYSGDVIRQLKYDMVSIEYLFRECNMHHHALGLLLHAPVILCGKPTTEIVVLKVHCSENEAEQLTRNVLNEMNTNYGIYSISVSDDLGNPHNPQIVHLNLENIKELC